MASPFAVQVRIADEVQANLNLAKWLREACENEMGAQYGVAKDGSAPKCGVDGKVVQKWRDVVKAFEALTTCKVKLDTSAKKLAETMSPEEELAAVRAYVRSLEPALRGAFLRSEAQWHEVSQKP